MFAGSIPALITPFSNGSFDEAVFREFVDWQIADGSHGLCPCGTTGESATMSIDEHNQVVAVTIEQAKNLTAALLKGDADAPGIIRQAVKAMMDTVKG